MTQRRKPPSLLVTAFTDAAESASSQNLSLRLLGGFELCANGRPLRIPDGLQRVLAFLALQTVPVRRTFVAGSLWSEKTEDRALANLRTTLWRMPEDGHGVVLCDRNSLALGPDVTVDYRDSLVSTRAVIREVDGGRPQALPVTEQFEFELLPDWYDEWIISERERLSQMRLRATEGLTRYFLAAGMVEKATEFAQLIVRMAPLHETGHILLTRAHLASGNRTEAVRQVLRLDAMLHAEFGLSASDEAWKLVDTALIKQENSHGNGRPGR
jgi:DNA-binding SARP family transcriptional activator